MGEEFNLSKPIYLQLAERITYQIVRKELSAGDKLPSVRELAIQSGVNPNTVQRTYSELERMGIVETKRGQGTFITENESVLSNLRETLKNDQILHFVREMREMGFSDLEMIEGMQQYFQSKGDTKA